MKTILMAASALALIAAPAFAQSTATVGLDANVAKTCSSIGAFSTVIELGALPLDEDGYLVGNGDFVGIPGGDLNALTGGAEVWCNGASTITVSGTPLVHESLDLGDRGRGFTDGFMRHIDLRIAGFNYGGVDFGDDLNSGSGLDNATASQTRVSTGAFAGEVEGVTELWTGDYVYGQGRKRPLGGAYRAEWVFTVSPNS